MTLDQAAEDLPEVQALVNELADTIEASFDDMRECPPEREALFEMSGYGNHEDERQCSRRSRLGKVHQPADQLLELHKRHTERELDKKTDPDIPGRLQD